MEDVYGSTWITAGMGSVVLLWGAAGDPLIELSHLKQPASQIGPLTVEHDADTGTMTVYRGAVDPLTFLRNSPGGATAADLARVVVTKDKPTDNERKKAQRALDRLARDGLAHRKDGVRGDDGVFSPARYYATETTR